MRQVPIWFWIFFGFGLGMLSARGIDLAYAGKIVGETATYARESGFQQRLFYVASGDGLNQVEFICRAFPGTRGSTDTSSTVWQVQRFTYDTSDRVSIIAFAGINDAFDQICDNRSSLTYS